MSKNKFRLSSSRIGHPFIELRQVESTNNYATGTVHAGMAQHGTAVFAHHQTAGKGQRSRQWLGEPGMNIALSIILQPQPLLLSQSFLLSMLAATTVHRFFSRYAGSETKVKWPNDVYWRDRKAAGILIENVMQGADWKWSVVGIGININQVNFEGLDNKPVSLRQICGKEFDTVQLAQELCAVFDDLYADFLLDPERVVATYQEQLYRRNEKVKFKKDGRVFESLIKGVTKEGLLIVQHALEERFAVGEVEWIVSGE